jgi:hypothetical protein
MRFLRGLSLVLGLSLLSTAPSFAAVTYVWPVQVSQHITMTNVAVPDGGHVALYCYVSPTSALIPVSVGTVTVPATTTPGGGLSYTGTVNVSVAPLSQTVPVPRSGDVAACKLWVMNANNVAQTGYALGQSTLTLP